MFRPFRFLSRWRVADVATPDGESEQEAYDRAWADYAEWSGLDEAGLPDAHRDGERS